MPTINNNKRLVLVSARNCADVYNLCIQFTTFRAQFRSLDDFYRWVNNRVERGVRLNRWHQVPKLPGYILLLVFRSPAKNLDHAYYAIVAVDAGHLRKAFGKSE